MVELAAWLVSLRTDRGGMRWVQVAQERGTYLRHVKQLRGGVGFALLRDLNPRHDNRPQFVTPTPESLPLAPAAPATGRVP